MESTLYRKYRPSSFDGVVGQQHITATLQNQLKSGRIGHAYLFCGSRGVGKTSLARIFARAINCQNPDSAPCGLCKACLDGKGESNLDIIEIDAASNNGVDDARDLREKVKYPPVLGKYKVYIIDETHMLTGSAFNALLKTLEEPPAHAVFILATTEPHKLPATILSRCMRFDFRLVSMHNLFDLLSQIFVSEGKKFDDESLRAIAAAAEGSVRDALSLADTCMSIDGGVLTAAQVDLILGGGSKQTEALFDRIAACDPAAALAAVDGLYTAGKSMSVIAKELSRYSRELMVARLAPDILSTTLERKNFLVSTAKEHTVESLAVIAEIFSDAESSLRYSVSPRVAFELLVIKAVKLYSMDISALEQRILRLERRLDELVLKGIGAAGVTEKTEKTEKKESIDKDAPKSIDNCKADSSQAALSKKAAVSEAGAVKLTAVQLWGRVITFFRRNSTPALTQAVGRQNPARLRLTADALTIYAGREDYLIMCDPLLTDTLKNALLLEGLSIRIIVEKDAADVDMEKEISGLMAEFGKGKVNIVE